ncbi:winged helix-turn-helix domain-containing protein [Salmonella enterica]|nr:hypothetical protein [Salmonella enterica]EGA0603422.1 hypothetical protein [Salmonella enterica]EHD2148892.1 hypothetical protein [Salmonella enterica]EHK2353381.1 winged helix-turn-helix domain-containing protein [Salmonella enterica]
MSQHECAYIIEKKVIFSPREMRLVMVGGQESIKLKPAISLCLVMLLQRQGNLIAQKELMEFAWGEKHREVSFNTFYQNILLLRKFLSQLGIEKQIIVTIPRKGLMVPEHINVVKNKENDSSPIKIIDNISHREVTSSKSFGYNFFLMAVSLVIMLLITIYFSLNRNSNYFLNYKLAGTLENKCKFYFNSDTNNFEKHKSIISNHPELCPKDNYLYITAYHSTKNVSAILCSLDIADNNKENCISIYFPRYDEL